MIIHCNILFFQARFVSVGMNKVIEFSWPASDIQDNLHTVLTVDRFNWDYIFSWRQLHWKQTVKAEVCATTILTLETHRANKASNI